VDNDEVFSIFLDNCWRNILEPIDDKVDSHTYHFVNNVALGKQIYVEPSSEDDWEILVIWASHN
jgi:hypothetical protein